MKLSDLIDSKYLRQEHVERDTLVTIRKITKANVARDDEEAEYKAIIKFDEFEKPMVANPTNLKRIARALGGDDDLDSWIGKQVVVYVDPDVEYGGKITGGLRIRAMTRAKTAPHTRSEDDVNRDLNDLDPPF